MDVYAIPHVSCSYACKAKPCNYIIRSYPVSMQYRTCPLTGLEIADSHIAMELVGRANNSKQRWNTAKDKLPSDS